MATIEVKDKHSGLKAQLVIAIDFGTTGTGYAFQALADFQSNPQTMYFLGRDGEMKNCKIPTCLLVNPDKTEIWFGEDAEDQHAKLLPSDNPKRWFFFRNFKMQLYGKENISGDMLLVDINGNELPALFVLSESIKWIKNSVLETLQSSGCPYLEERTKWVLTVPAIWSEAAKHIMRESAERAGIKSKNLCIALEPEVAAVYYSVSEGSPKYSSERDSDKAFSDGPRNTNIIVDMGGGTVDITTIENLQDGSMKQIHVAEGGPMGGNKVDDKFYTFMSDMLGPDIWQKFVEEDCSDFYEFRLSFERAKRKLSPVLRHCHVKDEFNISVPSNIIKEFEKTNEVKINEALKRNDKTNGKVNLSLGKLVFQGEILRSMMHESFVEIIEYICRIVEDVKQIGQRIHSVILVGGFASSKFMASKIRSNLETNLGITVKRPTECHLAVLKGAVLYGHNESILISRVVRMTYGIGVTKQGFWLSNYPKEKMFKEGWRTYVTGVFSPHVFRGQEVKIGEWISSEKYFPLDKDQKEIVIYIFSSDKKDTKMIDDCNYIGKCEIKLTDEQGKALMNSASIEVSFMFGRTELLIRAKDTATGYVVYETLNLKY